MGKTKDLETIIGSLRHAVEYHEWCDGGKRRKCKCCNQTVYSCQDSGNCEGCQKREAGIAALNRWEW